MGIHVDPDDVFHVLLDGVVTEMSLDALSDAYEGHIVRDETLLWQEGLGEWLRLDVVLAALEEEDAKKSFAPPVAEAEEMFAVLLGANEVKQMSLDQLNDAYRLSIVDDETRVWQPGFFEWQPLGALLGESEAPVPVGYGGNVASPSYGSSSYGTANHGAASYGSAPVASAPARPVPSSFAPVAYSVGPAPVDILPDLPIHAPKASPWFGRALATAGLAALALTFVQHGALHSALSGRSLAAVARFVPAPSLDTPLGTTRFLEELREKYSLDRLSETKPLATVAPASAPVEGSSSEPSKTEASRSEPASKTETAKTEALPASPPAGPAGDLRGQVLPLVPTKEAPKAAPKKKAVFRPSSKGPSYQGSNDPYDPMNGKL